MDTNQHHVTTTVLDLVIMVMALAITIGLIDSGGMGRFKRGPCRK